MNRFILALVFLFFQPLSAVTFQIPGPFCGISFSGQEAQAAFATIKENKISSAIVSGLVVFGLYKTQKYWMPLLMRWYMPKQVISFEGVAVQNMSDKEPANNNHAKESDIERFAKCKARVYQPHEIEVRMSDVAGNDNAKLDFADIISYLQNAEPYVTMGAKIPKGVMMYGNPGNGKTLLAKAVAGEANCPFISVNGSEFVEAIVGMGAARIRDLFKIAKELAPCIIFIDEIDALAKKRAGASFGGGADELAQTLAQLLVCMDGFDVVKKPIVVIGATNRFEVLDPAILRPGRFDRKVEITMPSRQDRKKILDVHFKKVKTAPTIDTQRIARATSDWSGAELAHLVNEAAIIAVNQKLSQVTMQEVDQAYDNIILGRQIHSVSRTKEEIYATALHEAGHTVTAIFCKDNMMPIQKVTVQMRSISLGVTISIPLDDIVKRSREQIRADIIMALGGRAADEYFGSGVTTGPSSDLQHARQLAYKMIVVYGMGRQDLAYMSYLDIDGQLPESLAAKIHEQVQQIIHECQQEAAAIVAEHAQEAKKLADLLVEKEIVYGDEIYKLFGLQEPQIEYRLS